MCSLEENIVHCALLSHTPLVTSQPLRVYLVLWEKPRSCPCMNNVTSGAVNLLCGRQIARHRVQRCTEMTCPIDLRATHLASMLMLSTAFLLYAFAGSGAAAHRSVCAVACLVSLSRQAASKQESRAAFRGRHARPRRARRSVCCAGDAVNRPPPPHAPSRAQSSAGGRAGDIRPWRRFNMALLAVLDRVIGSMPPHQDNDALCRELKRASLCLLPR